MQGEWKYINGFGTRYKLYSDGTIVSTKNNKPIRVNIKGNCQRVFLFDGEKYTNKVIHVLLKEYFGIITQNNIIENLSEEIWKDIPGYEGLYMISNKARVKRINKVYVGEYLMKQQLNVKNLLTVGVSKDDKSKTLLVHNIMGKVFLKNHGRHKMVIHLNGNKTDNRLENLKWVNNSEAQRTAVKLGLKKPMISSDNPASIMVDQYDADCVTYIKTWDCIADVERELKIAHPNISKVCRRKRLRAGGYHWRYTNEEIQ